MSARLAVARFGLTLLGLLVLAAPGRADLWFITDYGLHMRLDDWSPDGVLFEDNFFAPGGNCHLYLVPPTGGIETQVTFSPGTDNCAGAQFSPNMDYIAFMSNRDAGNANIWVMPWPGDDSQAVQLTFGGFDVSPTWSPDGTQIAFVRSNDIWVMPFPGGESQSLLQLTTHPSFDGFPKWSPAGVSSCIPGGPDGSLIAFASGRIPENQVEIFVIPPTGGDPTQITTLGGTEPDWHPDPQENRLVYRYSDPVEHENYELWLTEACPGADTARVQITDHPLKDVQPTWSPTGLSIAFLSQLDPGRPPEFKIYGLDIDGAPVAVPGGQGTPPAAASIWNYPNPFNPSTRFRIRTHVPVRGARLLLFDTGGRLVRSLPLGDQSQGEVDVLWDGRDGLGRELPSGAYFYQFIHTDGVSEVKKTIMLR